MAPPSQLWSGIHALTIRPAAASEADCHKAVPEVRVELVTGTKTH